MGMLWVILNIEAGNDYSKSTFIMTLIKQEKLVLILVILYIQEYLCGFTKLFTGTRVSGYLVPGYLGIWFPGIWVSGSRVSGAPDITESMLTCHKPYFVIIHSTMQWFKSFLTAIWCSIIHHFVCSLFRHIKHGINKNTDDFLGQVIISLADIPAAKRVDDWYTLQVSFKGSGPSTGGKCHLRMQFVSEEVRDVLQTDFFSMFSSKCNGILYGHYKELEDSFI